MEKNVFIFTFAGFVLATALGTLLHFVFEWTGIYAFAPISAVNESTWEHMKILFFPMLFIAIAQRRFFKDYDGFWWVKLIGILVGVISIPVLFYTANGAFGKTPDWLNVLFYFLSAGLGYFVEYLLFKRAFSLGKEWIAISVFVILALAFAIFTFYPPKLPLFQDPLTSLYGIKV